MKVTVLLAILWTSIAIGSEAPEFSQVQERRPELIWGKVLDPKLRESLDAYEQHKPLPNGVAYGSIIRKLRLDRLCKDQIESWAQGHGCARKDDVVKNSEDNIPILDHAGKPIPLIEFLCQDGGVVRMKPKGDPTSKKNTKPNTVKAMRFYGVEKYHNFSDEAFKVDNAGLPIPKWTKDLNTDLPELTDRTRAKFIEAWAKDAHTPLKFCR
jgi:hypothetical protein